MSRIAPCEKKPRFVIDLLLKRQGSGETESKPSLFMQRCVPSIIMFVAAILLKQTQNARDIVIETLDLQFTRVRSPTVTCIIFAWIVLHCNIS